MSNARNISRITANASGQIQDASFGAIPATKLSGQTPAANMTPGSVVQVVTGYDGSYNTTSVAGGSSTNWVSATITRKLSNSKILILFSGCYGQNNATDSGVRINSSLDGRLTGAEGASTTSAMKSVYSFGTDRGGSGNWSGASSYFMDPVSFHYVYTPSNSTATITITTQIYAEASMVIYPNGDGWRGGGDQSHSTGGHLILMEISV